ncbi:DUF1758 domain-containing protein [Trichonephila clavipes]|nr:DUF1758 domain-containing protein [Trichonephila clavipes]
MAAVDFLHQENLPIWAGVEPATLGAEGLRQTNHATQPAKIKKGLKRNKINIPVGGLNGATVTVGQQVSALLSSKNNEFVTDIEFLVVPKITDLTPSQRIDIDYIQLPMGITLADAQFFEPSKFDILLGAKTFFEVLKPNQIRINTRLDETLRSFWEIEALLEKTPIDDELKYCMEHLDTTHTRDSNGQYIVQMPIVKGSVQLGLSKDLVVKRFNSTLSRLNKNPDIKKLYRDFLDEYENLGHMEEVKEDILLQIPITAFLIKLC